MKLAKCLVRKKIRPGFQNRNAVPACEARPKHSYHAYNEMIQNNISTSLPVFTDTQTFQLSKECQPICRLWLPRSEPPASREHEKLRSSLVTGAHREPHLHRHTVLSYSSELFSLSSSHSYKLLVRVILIFTVPKLLYSIS